MQYTVYNGVRLRKDTADESCIQSSIQLPPNCPGTISVDGTSVIYTCPIQVKVNGVQQNVVVTFGAEDTTFQIRNVQIPLGYVVVPSQTSIAAIFVLLQDLQFCRGFETIPDIHSDLFNVETMQSLHEHHSTPIISRSKRCTFIMNWLAQSNTCEKCKAGSKTLKRKSDKQADCEGVKKRLLLNRSVHMDHKTAAATDPGHLRPQDTDRRTSDATDPGHFRPQDTDRRTADATDPGHLPATDPGQFRPQNTDRRTSAATDPRHLPATDPGHLQPQDTDRRTVAATDPRHFRPQDTDRRTSAATDHLRPQEPGDNKENNTEVTLDQNEHEQMKGLLNTILKGHVPENFLVLLQSQAKNCATGLDIHQRRWDPEVIGICLGLYTKSPQSYKYLKDSSMLVLPSTRLLRYYKNSIKQTTGINNENLQWMEREADRQGVKNFGKRGGLIVDEMSIQDDLVITRKENTWSIVGGVDMGKMNNDIDIICNGGKKEKLATHALQYVFHGFNGFRWPVAYYGANPATTHQLYNTFWELVDKLDERGLTVEYVMLDGASTNKAFMAMLFPGNPRDACFKFANIYYRQHKMCAMQDIMHVLKKIRNNVESSTTSHKSAAGRYLVLNDKPIVWDHWRACFKFNNQGGFRVHRKLTEEHLNLTPASKMRNKLATHVLDKDMLFLMKSYQKTLEQPEQLSSSIELLEKTSILVEIFCNTSRPMSSIKDERICKLNSIVQFFNSWETDVCESPQYFHGKHLITKQTRDDINSALTGFVSLCEGNMKDCTTSINPGFINSDIVENLFCQQRGMCNGANTNPTLAQFGPSNTSITLGQKTISSKCNSGNTALHFTATTPGALNPSQNKSSKKKCIRV
jgi:hypothetical protein